MYMVTEHPTAQVVHGAGYSGNTWEYSCSDVSCKWKWVISSVRQGRHILHLILCGLENSVDFKHWTVNLWWTLKLEMGSESLKDMFFIIFSCNFEDMFDVFQNGL